VKKATIGQSDNRTIGQSDNRTTKIHNGLNSRDRVGVDRSIGIRRASETWCARACCFRRGRDAGDASAIARRRLRPGEDGTRARRGRFARRWDAGDVEGDVDGKIGGIGEATRAGLEFIGLFATSEKWTEYDGI